MKSVRGCKPFPIDRERQIRCQTVLAQLDMTITELSQFMGWQKGYVSKLVSGRELSVANEARIANFLGVPVDFLFPQRTPQEIAALREQEAREKEQAQVKKAQRLELLKVVTGVA